MFIIDDYNINDSLVDSLFALDENCPWMKVDFYRSLSKRKLQKNMWLYNELTNIIHDPNIMFKVNWLAPGFCYYSSIVLNKHIMSFMRESIEKIINNNKVAI